MLQRLLLIDGDERLNNQLSASLRGEFQLETSESAHKALERFRAGSFNLVLLGSELQDMSGIAFLRILRGMEFGREMPVIFLPGARTQESMAEAFGLGVADYLPKPCDPRELLMRARAVLRRKLERTEHLGGELAVAGIRIDPSQRECVVNGRRVRLRPLEFDLLEILMRKSGRVLSRAYLLTTVWDMSSSADTRAVDAMVSRLRRSLGKRAGKLIETVSKLGYCFRDPDAL